MMTNAKEDKKSQLENQYAELFPTAPKTPERPRQPFVPPRPLKIVPTVTTYGAYEEPI